MAKTSKKRRVGEAWTGADHAERKAKRQISSDRRISKKKQQQHVGPAGTAAASSSVDAVLSDIPSEGIPSTRERATAIRTRGSQDKRDAEKLRLHTIKVQRQIEALRNRLEAWDPVAEKERQEQQERERQIQAEKQHATTEPKKRKGRKGPETWKLRGAARPAYEMYDFDVRYVDNNIKAQEEAKLKAARSTNILQVCKGRFGQESSTNDVENDDDTPPQPFCRQYLSLLMQLALLCLEGNKTKQAVAALEECMELDGTEHPITNARCRLMRIYLQINQPQLARQLWEERVPPHDKSVWIRYSAALMEFVSWKVLHEEGSTRASAETVLAQAIQSNVFCAFYLAFHESFASVMEYTDEIEDAPEGTLEEAIEYCCSEQMSLWLGTDGAITWIRSYLGRALGGKATNDGTLLLPLSDLDWNTKLQAIEKEHDDSSSQPNPEVEHDAKMYCGMFRTAMEMMEESGQMKQILEEATASITASDEESEDDSRSKGNSSNKESSDKSSGDEDSD